ncbi:MAG TPA: hypothetical protein VGP24_03625 [Glaciihabitans sp.]|nr:hypothetical protein [Glaciihabitans sp.]
MILAAPLLTAKSLAVAVPRPAFTVRAKVSFANVPTVGGGGCGGGHGVADGGGGAVTEVPGGVVHSTRPRTSPTTAKESGSAGM